MGGGFKKVNLTTRLKFKFKKFYYPTDVALRYGPIAREIKIHLANNPKILDVGSSGSGIARYIKYPVTGLDVDFGDTIDPFLTPVRQKGKSFPFADDEFDFVVSVDTLEHVPPKDREYFIKELIRVAGREAFIAVPTGNLSAVQDKELFDYFLREHGVADKYLSEHVEYGLPEAEEVLAMIGRSCRSLGKRYRVEVSKNVNLTFRSIFMRFSMSNGPILKSLYWLMSVFNPLWRFFNFGNCYRSVVLVYLS